MAFYNTCPKCGAHLDPGEKCDCEGLVPVTLKEANAFFGTAPQAPQGRNRA